MSKRKSTKIKPSITGWTFNETFTANGRTISKGTEVSIRGERGRFRFVQHVVTSKTEWIDFVGGVKGYEKYRSFSPDRIRRVHRIPRTRANLA